MTPVLIWALSLALPASAQAASPIRVPKDYKTIQAAINAATFGREIWVTKGTYPERITFKTGVALYGGFTGTETSRDQRDPKNNPTIIRPVIDTSVEQMESKVVAMESVTSATLDGFKITLAPVQFIPGKTVYIYGIYCYRANGTNTIANCVLADAHADCGPVGNYSNPSLMMLRYSQSSPATINCEVRDNRAENAVTLTGALFTDESGPVLTNCLFQNNTAYSRTVAVESAFCSPTFQDCRILNNSGAGVYFSLGSGVMVNCLIQGNVGYEAVGVRNTAADITLIKCRITQNDQGVNFYSGSTIARNCRIDHNLEGGVQNPEFREFTRGDFLNCVVDSNTGAGFDLGTSATINITNCTIVSNKGSEGDGIRCAWSTNAIVNVVSTIISGNDGIGINLMGKGPVHTLANCLFYQNKGGDYSDAQRGILFGGGRLSLEIPGANHNYTGDPKFAGSASGDYHLLNGSAALDRGLVKNAPTTDIEGNARPGADGLVDIGAYEAAAAYLPAPPSLPPSSFIQPIALATTAPTVELRTKAWDDDSTVVTYAIYYRKSPSSSWQRYGTFPASAASVTFDSRTTGGDSYYEFQSRATDTEGHTEAASATADTHTVIDTAHATTRVYISPSSTGAQSGKSWTTAVHDLTDGVNMARILGAKEIWVATGNYTATIAMWNGLKIYGSFAGNETSPAQRLIASHPTTINHPSGRAFTMDGTRDAVVDGFVIAVESSQDSAYVRKTSGDSRFENCTFPGRDHTSSTGIKAESATLAVNRCNFQIYRGVSATTSTLTVSGSTFTDDGSAIVSVASTIQVSTSRFSGPGSASKVDSSNSILRFSRCVFQSCKIGTLAFASATAQNRPAKDLVYINIPPPYGAAIYAAATNLTLESCLFDDNETSYRPGFMGPPIEPSGGAIYLYLSPLQCTGCTFANNRLAPAFKSMSLGGGAIKGIDGTMSFTNTIFSGNNLHAISGGPIALSHCIFFNNPDGDYDSTATRHNVTTADPKYVDPANKDYHLTASSPAIDAGQFTSTAQIDLDGNPRGYPMRAGGNGSHFDIGAYEFYPPKNRVSPSQWAGYE